MPLKRVVAQIGNTEIKVENTWLGGAKLFIDDKPIVTNSEMIAINKNTPLITTRAVIDGVERLVEIYVYAIFRVKIKICVDGTRVAGDRF